jgi:hypothetical protein
MDEKLRGAFFRKGARYLDDDDLTAMNEAGLVAGEDLDRLREQVDKTAAERAFLRGSESGETPAPERMGGRVPRTADAPPETSPGWSGLLRLRQGYGGTSPAVCGFVTFVVIDPRFGACQRAADFVSSWQICGGEKGN